MPTRSPLPKLRRLALALPEAHEVEAWGAPTFRLRNKLFAMYAANHHGVGRPGVWIKATPGNQALMLAAKPTQFYKPPYVGPSGWIGIWLDGTPDWKEVADLLVDAHRQVAPKRMLASLDAAPVRPTRPSSTRR
jgi:hypothetical protein